MAAGFQACDLPKRQAVVMNKSITFLKISYDCFADVGRTQWGLSVAATVWHTVWLPKKTDAVVNDLPSAHTLLFKYTTANENTNTDTNQYTDFTTFYISLIFNL